MPQESQRPHEIPIHVSANRPNQLLGADREMVIGCGLIAVFVAFGSQNLAGIITGLIFWIVSVAVLQRISKADPLFRSVYMRHLRYRGFYSARCGLHTPTLETRNQWR
jgi:type IV secretory pathway TrbD component